MRKATAAVTAQRLFVIQLHVSLIQVELKTTVKEADVEQCWDLLRRKVANAQAELPEGAATPLVKDDFGNVYGMFYALTGDGLQDIPSWAEVPRNY